MPALFVASFAYDTSSTPHDATTKLDRFRQDVFFGWNEQQFRAAMREYLDAAVPRVVELGWLSAFYGKQIAAYLASDHLQTALATFEAALVDEGMVEVGCHQAIFAMTAHRATLPIRIASAFGHGAPAIYLDFTDDGLDRQLQRVSMTARSVVRHSLPSLPRLADEHEGPVPFDAIPHGHSAGLV
jgi:hypothetical protein